MIYQSEVKSKIEQLKSKSKGNNNNSNSNTIITLEDKKEKATKQQPLFASLGKNYFLVEAKPKPLENKFYSVEFSMERGFFLKESEPVVLPEKIYGDPTFYRLVMDYYNKTNKGFSALLIGEKGCGKTLLAKTIATQMQLPVIQVNEPFTSGSFVDFIESIGDCVVLFDEIDKVYQNDKQSPETMQRNLLQLLDAKTANRRIHLMTCNKEKLNEYFDNRPSRILFRRNYSSISLEDLREIAVDFLQHNKKQHLPSLELVYRLIPKMNYDTLIEIINLINLFDLSADKVIEHMNIHKKEIISVSVEITEDTPENKFDDEDDELTDKKENKRTINLGNYFKESKSSSIVLEAPRAELIEMGLVPDNQHSLFLPMVLDLEEWGIWRDHFTVYINERTIHPHCKKCNIKVNVKKYRDNESEVVLKVDTTLMTKTTNPL